jgi:putative transcriptional regulator
MKFETPDTIDALLGSYVAGALPAPAQILVECHLALKPGSRAIAAQLEALAGTALAGDPPVELHSPAARMEAIFASSGAPSGLSDAPSAAGIFPAPLRRLVGFDADQVPWRSKMPGFREYEVGEIDGCHVTLFWIRPGRRIPSHTHEGTELSLVLDGAFNDVNGRYGRGDISIADDSVDHRPTAEKDRPCIGMAVTDGQLLLTGPFHRRLGDILGV